MSSRDPDSMVVNVNFPRFGRIQKVTAEKSPGTQNLIPIMDDNNLEPQVQPLINGCFNWMIPNLYIGNGWKSPNIHFKLVV